MWIKARPSFLRVSVMSGRVSWNHPLWRTTFVGTSGKFWTAKWPLSKLPPPRSHFSGRPSKLSNQCIVLFPNLLAIYRMLVPWKTPNSRINPLFNIRGCTISMTGWMFKIGQARNTSRTNLWKFENAFSSFQKKQSWEILRELNCPDSTRFSSFFFEDVFLLCGSTSFVLVGSSSLHSSRTNSAPTVLELGGVISAVLLSSTCWNAPISLFIYCILSKIMSFISTTVNVSQIYVKYENAAWHKKTIAIGAYLIFQNQQKNDLYITSRLAHARSIRSL